MPPHASPALCCEPNTEGPPKPAPLILLLPVLPSLSAAYRLWCCGVPPCIVGYSAQAGSGLSHPWPWGCDGTAGHAVAAAAGMASWPEGCAVVGEETGVIDYQVESTTRAFLDTLDEAEQTKETKE